MGMEEIWKDVKGYEGLYQVSNLGRVKSLDHLVKHRHEGRMALKRSCMLKPKTKKNGYLFVCLSNESKLKYFHIHRLVAQEFIPNPENLPEVNHKDENKTNNCVENLEWCTHKYNNTYGTKIKRHQKHVTQYLMDGTPFFTYFSVKDATEATHSTHIIECCQGKRPTAGGYKWHYAS